MRALGLGLTASRLAQHHDMADCLLDRRLEIRKVDWLGQKVERAAIHRRTDIVHVTVCGNDNGGFLVVHLLQLL